MKFLKKIVQTGILASLLYSGVCSAQTIYAPEPSLIGIANVEAEYQKRGYTKVPEFEEKHGFPLYLTRHDTNVLSRIEDALSRLSPQLKHTIKDMRINTSDAGEKAGKVVEKGKTTNGRVAIFSAEGIENGNFYHEVAHAWMQSLSRDEGAQLLTEWKNIARFEYGDQHTLERTRWKTGEQAERSTQLEKKLVALRPIIVSESTELSKLQKEIGSGNYSRMSRYHELRVPFNQKAIEYNELAEEYNALLEKLSLPREGVFSAYGSTEITEDIAEAAETMFAKKDEALRLMNDADPRYAAKMRLFAEKTGMNLEKLLK